MTAPSGGSGRQRTQPVGSAAAAAPSHIERPQTSLLRLRSARVPRSAPRRGPFGCMRERRQNRFRQRRNDRGKRAGVFLFAADCQPLFRAPADACKDRASARGRHRRLGGFRDKPSSERGLKRKDGCLSMRTRSQKRPQRRATLTDCSGGLYRAPIVDRPLRKIGRDLFRGQAEGQGLPQRPRSDPRRAQAGFLRALVGRNADCAERAQRGMHAQRGGKLGAIRSRRAAGAGGMVGIRPSPKGLRQQSAP